jgi:hypothetical protein
MNIGMSSRAAACQAEGLADLSNADRASLDVRFQLRDGLFRPAGTDVTKVHAREHPEAVLVRAGVDDAEQLREPFARGVAGARHHAQIELVHLGDHSRQPLGAIDAGWVAVNVDNRKLGARDRRLGVDRNSDVFRSSQAGIPPRA